MMKKTFKVTAAAIAAIMAISCTALPSFADSTNDTGIVFEKTGGWAANSGSVAMSKNPEAKAAFKKATKDIEGVKYEAIALLGSQVVAGMNYAILCRETELDPNGGAASIKVMYIYADLQGNAEITGFQTLIGGQILAGGFSANTGKFGLSKNKNVKKAFNKAMNEIDGVEYTPVAYLGSQVVAGTNYKILCRARVVYPDAPYKWVLVTIYNDLSGNASMIDAEELVLSHSNIDEEEGADEDIGVMIANPWQEYSSVEEAAKAAGVEFKAPKKIGDYKMSCVQAMKGLVDVRYTKDGKEICIRKGLGTDDVSGDCNNYKKTVTKKINGNTVTLKGNGKSYKAAVWTDGEYAYSVISDKGLSEKSMKSIIKKIG